MGVKGGFGQVLAKRMASRGGLFNVDVDGIGLILDLEPDGVIDGSPLAIPPGPRLAKSVDLTGYFNGYFKRKQGLKQDNLTGLLDSATL